jgi:hypothetical protein
MAKANYSEDSFWPTQTIEESLTPKIKKTHPFNYSQELWVSISFKS